MVPDLPEIAWLQLVRNVRLIYEDRAEALVILINKCFVDADDGLNIPAGYLEAGLPGEGAQPAEPTRSQHPARIDERRVEVKHDSFVDFLVRTCDFPPCVSQQAGRRE